MKPTDRLPFAPRTPAQRLSALLVTLLFLFTWTGEALGMHPCPHHDSVPGAMAHAMTMDGGHGASASHDAPAPAEHGGHHACTCQGSCPSAAGGALPARAEAAVRVAPASVAAAPRGEAKTVVPRLVPFFLPYGQAPPLLG